MSGARTIVSARARLTRRALLQAGLTGATAAGLAVLLGACGAGTAPTSSALPVSGSSAASLASAGKTVSSASSKLATSAQAGGNAKAILPAYAPVQPPFKPDLPSPGPNIDDGYLRYPKQPFKSVTEKPGSGKDVSLMTGTFWPPFTPIGQNPMVQQLQKDLNVNLKINIINGADYNVKFNAMLAGQDLPDVFWVGATPNLVDFLKGACADLTPYLAGDAVKDYPNLANLLTYSWKGAIFEGAIRGIPMPLGAMSENMDINKTRWDAEIGANVWAKDPDELKKMFLQLTKPAQNKWALGSNISDPFGVTSGATAWFAMMFGAVNNWDMVNGKLTNFRESPAYKQAIGYARDLQQAGAFYPKAATVDSVAAKSDHIQGQFVAIGSNAFLGNVSDMWNRGAALNPPVKFDLLHLVPPTPGGKLTYWLSPFIWPKNNLGPGIAALKKASPDRIKELLRVMNYLAAPFGSQEWLLLTYGVKDIDYTLDTGDVTRTQRGPADSTFVDGPLTLLTHGPQVLYNAGTPDFAPVLQKNEEAMIPHGILDATTGVYSNTDGSKSASLNSSFQSAMVDIIAGRQPLSSFDQALKNWQANGGDQIRKEYEAGLAAAQ